MRPSWEWYSMWNMHCICRFVVSRPNWWLSRLVMVMEERNKLNVEELVVGGGSFSTLIYVPNFISPSDQLHLLHQIYESPVSKWKSLKNRRLQNWGGVVHEKGLLPQPLPSWLTKITQRICEETGLFPSPINHVLINEYLPHQGIMPHQDGPAYFPVVAILSLGSPAVMTFSPHSRLREYDNMARDTGIHNISDNAEAENKTGICSDHHDVSVLLMPCSLLIFKDEAYSDYLHGIEDKNVHQLDKVVNAFECQKQEGQEGAVEVECTDEIKSIKRTSTRVSLTCRLVLKVHKNLFKF